MEEKKETRHLVTEEVNRGAVMKEQIVTNMNQMETNQENTEENNNGATQVINNEPSQDFNAEPSQEFNGEPSDTGRRTKEIRKNVDFKLTWTNEKLIAANIHPIPRFDREKFAYDLDRMGLW